MKALFKFKESRVIFAKNMRFNTGSLANTDLFNRSTVILSRSKSAVLVRGTVIVKNWRARQLGDARVSRDAQGHTYTQTGSGRLIVDGKFVVERWSAGQLSLNMTAAVTKPNPVTWTNTPASPSTSGPTIYGDRKPADTDAAQSGVQIGYDLLGNLLVTAELEANRADTLYDSDTNNRIEAGGGSDTVVANKGGNDNISLGAGNDWGFGGLGDDVIEGGADTDIIVGEDGADWLFADAQSDVASAIAQGNEATGTGQRGDWLNGGQGDDVAIGSNGNDLLAGSGGGDLLLGGAGDDDIWGDADIVAQDHNWTFTTSTTAGNSVRTPAGMQGVLEAANGAGDVIYAGAGRDYVRGGADRDFAIQKITSYSMMARPRGQFNYSASVGKLQ